MALHFVLKLNGQPIGYFNARRKEHLTNGEQVSTYEIAVSHNQTERRFEVKHRYNDGALVLVRKALAAMERMDG
jgi:hypothetical protein